MNILILTHRVPFPQNGGYPIVVGNTIRGLVDKGHTVSLISLNEKKETGKQVAQDELLDRIDHRVFNIDTSISMMGALIKLLGKQSTSTDRYYDAGFEKFLIAEVKKKEFDIIQFEGLFVATYLESVRKNTKAKLIYRAHNIEHQVWERVALQKQDPLKRWFVNLVARRIKKYELQQIKGFDGISVFTQQDKKTIESYELNVNLEVIPVGIDMDHYRPEPRKTQFPSLFFLGSLDWMPNREGIEWFLENFHNDIVNGELRTKFYVAGNDIPEQFDEYEALDKIYIKGEVDNALEFVNSKSVMIVPLLSGGGMRVKIVEGMAMQKCIISTSLGAEGIQYHDGGNIIIANTRQEFYDAIQRCTADEEYCKQIGLNARRMIEAQHDIGAITTRLVMFYKRVLPKDVN
ncbi:glycosyltransferase family 4 protein [Mucilaginibacter myungsuensis]|uniref:Glycosyltransferase family 4 protein n=1 Tax=Mucilaginibacter myungsuensis TaxID=649104 RepID=A0A929KT47_9SPHI|nr:glycosyltransferase family 4 protein [Mucilaginibacter myungsuensis]MBE9661059.1 glycosyltransferase family 4 protein [Mucilaginibacter myungsuensis]MDN3597203.1 glycosyltransferase family 4 protein [Mucilaginibacter myungsuensis]